MSRTIVGLYAGWLLMVCAVPLLAQKPAAVTSGGSTAVVPPLVSFGGTLTDNGKPLSGVVGVTFALYEDAQGGAPLWLETQNVYPDKNGHYTVMLGSSKSAGLPGDLFVAGEARWLGVQAQGQAEQPRVMLLSVPYALKSGDAETVGGLPPSAFVRATSSATTGGNGSSAMAATASNTGTSAGTLNVNRKASAPTVETQSYVAKFINGIGGLGNSLIFDNGTNVGIGTTAPKDALDVVGGTHLDFSNLNSGAFGANLAFGDSTSGEGISSARQGTTNKYGLDFWTFKQRRMSITSTGNVGIGTAAPTDAFDVVGSAHVDFANKNTGTSTPKLAFGDGSSGEGISSTRGAGTTNKYGLDFWTYNQRRMSITSTGNVGIGTSTPGALLEVNGTAQFDGLVTFAGGVSGNLTANGAVTGSSFDIGGNLFAFGSYSAGNAFLGFAGNTTTTGSQNVASGALALYSNSTGSSNTASGYQALFDNSTGNWNTASGGGALYSNTTGYDNTASGFSALYNNVTGNDNTASGRLALFSNTGDASGNGSSNAASGTSALYSNTTGNANTASGASALYSNTIGSQDTASGEQALLNNVTGSENTAVGAIALAWNATGSYNSALGYSAGTDKSSTNLSNTTAIGAFADVTQNNALVLGSTAAQNGSANVSVGIDVGNPSNILTVLQGGGHAIADGWDTYSSRRWKTHIRTLNGALSKVEQLRGVSYELKDSGKHEIGVIAEEVGAVVPEVVSYEQNGKDARGVDYSRLTALLIEATKEQQALIHQQQQEITRLRSQVKSIQTTLKISGRTNTDVRTVKTAVQMVHQ